LLIVDFSDCRLPIEIADWRLAIGDWRLAIAIGDCDCRLRLPIAIVDCDCRFAIAGSWELVADK